jgi:hypothetical protein
MRSSKGSYNLESGILRPAKQQSTSIGLDGSSSKDCEISNERSGSLEDINIDTDIDWMLMSDGKPQSDNRAADLYSLLSNPVAMHPERGSV